MHIEISEQEIGNTLTNAMDQTVTHFVTVIQKLLYAYS